MNKYKARILQVIDGGTLYLKFNTGFDARKYLVVRLGRVILPPTSTMAAKQAREFVKQFEGQNVTVSVSYDQSVKIDKYLAEVTVEHNNHSVNLNELLVTHGYAVWEAKK